MHVSRIPSEEFHSQDDNNSYLCVPILRKCNFYTWNFLIECICILYTYIYTHMAFQGRASGKEPACQFRRLKRNALNPWVGNIPWRRAWQPTPIFLPGECYGQKRLVGYSPWGSQDQTLLKRLSTHTRIYTYTYWYIMFSLDKPNSF